MTGTSLTGGVPPGVQQVYEQMMRGQVAPALRALGLTGTSRVFRMRRNGHYGEVRWQKDGRQARRQLLRFTANVAYWLGGDRIAELMPEPQPDLWWELRGGEPAGPVASSVVEAVRRYALPAILAGLDDQDRLHDAGVRWPRTFPPVPHTAARLPDGGGADPGAWFIRAAGTDADDSFADLASDLSGRRLYAAKWVAAHALGDPRALPALLDRLEHDPCPAVRKVVASRMLTRLAHQPQARAALRTAAASDHDPVVRWAARYALRVDARPGASRRDNPGQREDLGE